MGCKAVLGLQGQAKRGKHQLQGAICESAYRCVLHSSKAEKTLAIQACRDRQDLASISCRAQSVNWRTGIC